MDSKTVSEPQNLSERTKIHFFGPKPFEIPRKKWDLKRLEWWPPLSGGSAQSASRIVLANYYLEIIVFLRW